MINKNYIKIIILVSFFIIPFCSLIGENTDSLWNEAADLYSKKQFTAAAEKYAKILESGESAELYFNYANSLYKSNNIGLAILNYERALRLDPSNKDIQFNLDYVNKVKTDKIEPLEKFFLTEWLNSLGKIITSNNWAYFSAILFFVTLILLLLYLFGKIMWIRKTSFFTSIFLFLFSIIALIYSFKVKNNIVNNQDAIVLSGSVSVKSTPDLSGTEVFVIHEGTKVSVKSTLKDWSEIQLEDGNIGWLQTKTIEKI